MGFDIKEYSERIQGNIVKLKEITPEYFFIPIKQVAYRFNLDNEEMYLDYPYNETVKEQNEDFKNPKSEIFGLDDEIFNYFNNDDKSDLKYLLYNYEYVNEKPIIRSIDSTIPEFEEKEKFKNIIKAFRIIHYNGTLKGHYLDDISYEKTKPKRKDINSLLFVFDGFNVDCALTEEKRFSYLNITFDLGQNHNIHDERTIKTIKHLIFDLKLFGETLLINPLSEEKKEDVVNKRLKGKIRDDRHTILNFLNAINRKTELISDSQLRNGTEILFRILEDVITEEEERPDVWRRHEYDKPDFILNKLTEYFNGDNSKRLNLNYKVTGESNLVFEGLEGYAYLTIMYNLLHNAHKSSGYRTYNLVSTTYSVMLEMREKVVITKVITPAILGMNIIQFLRDEISNDEAGLEKSGGLAISKKLALKNGWKLTACNKLDKKENIVTLEINYHGKN
jgi:hypothetical protein